MSRTDLPDPATLLSGRDADNVMAQLLGWETVPRMGVQWLKEGDAFVMIRDAWQPSRDIVSAFLLVKRIAEQTHHYALTYRGTGAAANFVGSPHYEQLASFDECNNSREVAQCLAICRAAAVWKREVIRVAEQSAFYQQWDAYASLITDHKDLLGSSGYDPPTEDPLEPSELLLEAYQTGFICSQLNKPDWYNPFRESGHERMASLDDELHYQWWRGWSDAESPSS